MALVVPADSTVIKTLKMATGENVVAASALRSRTNSPARKFHAIIATVVTHGVGCALHRKSGRVHYRIPVRRFPDRTSSIPSTSKPVFSPIFKHTSADTIGHNQT